jgi:geranylgeranylglycerol-phosphate geranylgeranyltransferase
VTNDHSRPASFLGYWDILRPSNIILLFLGSLLGSYCAAGLPMFVDWRSFAAAFSAICVGGSGNVINDVMDIDIDRINKPNRPLPSEHLSIRQAKRYWLLLGTLGVATGLVISPLCAALALVTVGSLYLYSRFLKRLMLVGNVLIAFFVSLGFLYGAIALGNVAAAWFAFSFSFIINLGRELLKDLEDVIGDKACGAMTFPVRFGSVPSLVLVTICFALMLPLTIIPFYTGDYGRWYFAIVMLGTNLPAMYTLISAWRDASKDNLYRLNTLLKVAMLFGILAIAAGKL